MNQPTDVRNYKPKKSQGGILRSILRPFMPEVAAGIDAADSLLSGEGAGGALAMASKMLQKEDLGGDEDPPVTVELEGGDPEERGEAEDGPGEEADEEGSFDFTPPELESLKQIVAALPGAEAELREDPSLLDGVMTMAGKLKSYFAQGGQASV